MRRPRSGPVLSLLFLLFGGGSAWGTGPAVSASGHLKNLWQYSASTLDRRPYFLNTSRARLELETSVPAGDFQWKTRAEYDHESLSGSFFRTKEYRRLGLAEPTNWLTMDQTISTSATSIWRHRLYRGWTGLESERAVLRFGRQRVAWGTGRIWNPTDVLNPYQPTAVEREERRGVDALYGRLGLGELTQTEAAWAPHEDWRRTSLLGRLRSNARGFDVSVMGGKTDRSTTSWIVGGDFAGELKDGTLRGEFSLQEPGTRTPFWRLGVGYDYNFTADWPLAAVFLREAVMAVEYYHNGLGSAHVHRYDYAALANGKDTAVAKDYAGLTYSKDAHALLKLELSVIANLNDLSSFAAPSIQWNALPDLYLSAGFHRNSGARITEFGRLPNLGFLQVQYFF